MTEPFILTVRKPVFNLKDFPAHYWAGRRGRTHFINALHILFPPAERYFVRVFNRAVRELSDPNLKELAKGFSGQEIEHSRQHQAVLEEITQRYDLQEMNEFFERFFRKLEDVFSLKANMAAVAGIEHFTALFGNILLSQPEIFDDMYPPMRDLILWHAAEEIEHKSAAFDVYLGLGGGYWTRFWTMIPAVIGIFLFMHGISLTISRRDGDDFIKHSIEEFGFFFFGNHRVVPRSIAAVIEYLKPDFHPGQIDDFHLAREMLSKITSKVSREYKIMQRQNK